MTEHIALIPAKEVSLRCDGKNWRPFVSDKNLVSYLISLLPEGFFDKVILSTDKSDIDNIDRVTIHHRDKKLATKDSPVNDLISEIIATYDIHQDSYIWLLNPTSPIRMERDFHKIKELVLSEQYTSIVSASEVNPFVWKDTEPLFDTSYPRKNTQEFSINYCVENGQFIVFKVDSFLNKKTWYGDDCFLYKQKGVHSFIDIDTDDDFYEAQRMIRLDVRNETMKNETLSVDHIIRDPIKDHVKLLYNHFRRYDLAIRKLDISKGNIVIDASCGKGYGSFLLSEKADTVYGLDVNEAYLKAANIMFKADNCNYLNYKDFYEMCESEKISKAHKIVCIETFEHILRENVDDYISRLLSCLMPGGDMFLTIPLGGNGPSSYNEYHLNEPSIDYVYDLFCSRFGKIRFEVETLHNSFGHDVKYCAVVLKAKEDAVNEIQ